MSREHIKGVLHVIQTRKYRGQGFERLIELLLEESGAIKPEYYPPTYFILTDQTVGQRRADDRKWRNDEPFQFRFRGRPRALSPDLRGHMVAVRASVETFHNGLGGYLDRPQVLETGGYVECPHHDDPYDNLHKGSSRVFCKNFDLVVIEGEPE